MKKKRSIQTAICAPFCAYYKPGKNEELACRADGIAERLIRSGIVLPAGKADRSFDRARAETLVEALCRACDFREDGCDFMMDRMAPPCGGFVLLARLLESGVIEIEDI